MKVWVRFIIKKIKKPSRDFVFLLLVFVITILLVICLFCVFLDREDKVFDFDGEVFGVKISQTVYGNTAQIASKKAQKQIETALFQISNNENSQIKKIIDDSKKSWTNVSPGVFNVLKKSSDVASSSDGAFDFISTGYKSLKLNEDNLKARLVAEDSDFNLKDIESGFLCMLAINQYKKEGSYAGIIKIGNSFGIFGDKKDRKPFEVPVYDKQKTLIGNLKFKDGISTVAYCEEGKDFTLVVVVHKDGILSSAICKACTNLTEKKSLSLVKKYNAEAMFVRKNEISFSENFSLDFEVLDENFKKV